MNESEVWCNPPPPGTEDIFSNAAQRSANMKEDRKYNQHDDSGLYKNAEDGDGSRYKYEDDAAAFRNNDRKREDYSIKCTESGKQRVKKDSEKHHHRKSRSRSRQRSSHRRRNRSRSPSSTSESGGNSRRRSSGHRHRRHHSKERHHHHHHHRRSKHKRGRTTSSSGDDGNGRSVSRRYNTSRDGERERRHRRRYSRSRSRSYSRSSRSKSRSSHSHHRSHQHHRSRSDKYSMESYTTKRRDHHFMDLESSSTSSNTHLSKNYLKNEPFDNYDSQISRDRIVKKTEQVAIKEELEEDEEEEDEPIKENAYKNDGSFMDMFKKMQEDALLKEKAEAATAVKVENSLKNAIGRRRGGKILKTGMVEKSRAEEDVEEAEEGTKDAWSMYMKEVKRYKEACCDDDSKTRLLVK